VAQAKINGSHPLAFPPKTFILLQSTCKQVAVAKAPLHEVGAKHPKDYEN